MQVKSQLPDLSKLSDDELDEYLAIVEQIELEKVSPRLEEFRKPARYKIAYGGRGAGAKSWGIASLLVQMANERPLKILNGREMWKSIEESSYSTIKSTVKRLGYKDWRFTADHAFCDRTGSMFSFIGLKDARANDSVKSYEGYDIFWGEEAQSISSESWKVVLPTIRKSGSEIWAGFNRTEENDPVFDIFCRNPRPNSIIIDFKPGRIDNPWWTNELQAEMDEDYRIDPDESEHKWGGLPRKQGLNSVISRIRILAAMKRDVQPNADDDEQIGCDVARFGDDTTQMYRRKGMKFIDHKELVKADTTRVANELWDFGDRNPYMRYCIDVGAMGAGVIDQLRRLGAQNVIEIGFGSNAADTERFADCATEMWFTFPIDNVDLSNVNNQKLIEELAGRRYGYVKGTGDSDRKKIEPKGDYKKRLGRSPDYADAAILTTYNPGRSNGQISGLDAGLIGL